MKKIKLEHIAWILIGGGLLVILFPRLIFGILPAQNIGVAGDYIGGIAGSIWALAGVLLFYQALKLQQKEISLTIDEFKEQNENLKLQRFENLFSSLLNNLITQIRETSKTIDENASITKGKNDLSQIDNDLRVRFNSNYLQSDIKSQKDNENLLNLLIKNNSYALRSITFNHNNLLITIKEHFDDKEKEKNRYYRIVSNSIDLSWKRIMFWFLLNLINTHIKNISKPDKYDPSRYNKIVLTPISDKEIEMIENYREVYLTKNHLWDIVHKDIKDHFSEKVDEFKNLNDKLIKKANGKSVTVNNLPPFSTGKNK